MMTVYLYSAARENAWPAWTAWTIQVSKRLLAVSELGHSLDRPGQAWAPLGQCGRYRTLAGTTPCCYGLRRMEVSMAERRIINLRIGEELEAAVRAYAAKTGHTLSSALRFLVAQGLEVEDKRRAGK